VVLVGYSVISASIDAPASVILTAPCKPLTEFFVQRSPQNFFFGVHCFFLSQILLELEYGDGAGNESQK